MSGKTYDLVFSDEFNIAGRSFADGADPRWTAINKDDYTNDALQYYRGVCFIVIWSHFSKYLYYIHLTYHLFSSLLWAIR